MHPFAVLADDTRRAMVEALSQGEHSVNDLVARFAVSQPAISQHLRVLREAGLVYVRAERQRRYYSLRPEGFRVIELWLERYRRQVASNLDALERHLDAMEEQGR
jgi:DNA-binding transcriptional ArsR family regulator